MNPKLPFHRPDHRGTWRSYTLADGLIGLEVEHIAEDAEGFLWFATWASGVSRYDGYEFHNFTRNDDLRGDQVIVIVPLLGQSKFEETTPATARLTSVSAADSPPILIPLKKRCVQREITGRQMA